MENGNENSCQPRFEESEEVDQGLLYQSAVGKLLYLSTKTRPDIMFAVSYVAKFCIRPTAQHWKAIKQILDTAVFGWYYQCWFSVQES